MKQRHHLLGWRRRNYKTRNMAALLVMSIFSTLHLVIPLYVNSNFLSSVVGDNLTSIAYSIASIITIFALIAITKTLQKYGNYTAAIGTLVLEFVSLAFLSANISPFVTVLAFLGHITATTLVLFFFDVFLESFSDDASTGTTRGTYLTFINVAFLIAPILAGFILNKGDFSTIYAVSFLFLIPVALLLIKYFRDFRDPHYEKIVFFKTLGKIMKNPDLKNIFWSHFLLKAFFAWMVIYTPLYLFEVVGFDFKTIGTILTIMLAAYVLFELPLGRWADKKHGEKHILYWGYIVIAIATMSLSFITGPNIFLWGAALFVTRIGAAMVEISTESYFFKKIDSHDTDEISFFRMIRPFAYLVAPLFATLFLFVFDFRWLFVAIGLIMFIGLHFTKKLHTIYSPR